MSASSPGAGAAERIPITGGLFTVEGGEARLVGGHCPACGRCHFPAFHLCPYCSAGGCTERRLGRRGTLRLFTVVTNRPPGYRGAVPFGFGVVELPEKLRIISRLTEARLDRLRVGQPMLLVLTPLHVDDEGREVVSYAFAPEETDAGAPP
jgi:uncharacterized OB-fold protein